MALSRSTRVRITLFYALIFALIALWDARLLTRSHYTGFIPPCPSWAPFVKCDAVLTSKYAVMFGLPLALIGMVHYVLESVAFVFALMTGRRLFKWAVVVFAFVGAGASLYFVFLQLVVLQSICLYCMLSALLSFMIFGIVYWQMKREVVETVAVIGGVIYRYIVKPILFLINPEVIHEVMVDTGQVFGRSRLVKQLMRSLLVYPDARLGQVVRGITFDFPIGLAAGFDYDAKLTQVLEPLGFGFQTVGTVTNKPYEGNPRPRLGRLPRSRSLMVNKGFKSVGAKTIAEKLAPLSFPIPLGVSIGRTNSRKLKTQKQSVADIVSAFKTFESKDIDHAFYELNISCPNLFGDISFYPIKNLKELLDAVKKLKLGKPVFIKMPITESDAHTKKMLEVIAAYPIAGVIFGNLQKDRKNPALVQEEVEKFKTGNFSGKPTWKRSNELIQLAYKTYGKKLVIIGCGGVFSARDAYTKIRSGASLVQLITGMIYEGPQRIAQMNLELSELLEADGFSSISDAVGIDA